MREGERERDLFLGHLGNDQRIWDLKMRAEEAVCEIQNLAFLWFVVGILWIKNKIIATPILSFYVG